ncbi:MAG: TIGR00730 family Rossman fold protein [Beijerinckiaceae bacterium]|nr:TIGR00730 family Rossman fold protein [Beijerinckiaceae bacterium]
MLQSHQMNQSPKPAGATSPFKAICVYCGSAGGTDPLYLAAARYLGAQLAAEGISLVYGGGGRGMMGAVARATIEHGGNVIAIIPDFLTDQDAMLIEAQEHIVVPDMHTRKRLMFERSDAFVALPGGIGTLEELVEQLTWIQLERHTKPVLIADIGGFWRPLLSLFEHMRERRFIKPETEIRYHVAEKVEDILPMLESAAARLALTGVKKETIDSERL